MKSKQLLLMSLSFGLIFINWITFDNKWSIENHSNYNLFCRPVDEKNKKEYHKLIENGINSVMTFFGSSFSKQFDVYIHPNHNSLDSTWRVDWKMIDFKSECWMVAGATALKADLISPEAWDKESCEHKYSDKQHTQNLITHELVHVYYGQQNASPGGYQT